MRCSVAAVGDNDLLDADACLSCTPLAEKLDALF